MPTVAFTARWIDSVKADSRVDYFDKAKMGKGRYFGLRVGPGGKSWFVAYRHDGKLKRFTLDRGYPDLGLADAREEANRLVKELIDHKDPAAAKQQLKQAETFRELAALYMEKYAKVKKRTWKRDDLFLNKDAIPAWGDMKAHEITRRHVKALLQTVVDRGSPINANRDLEILRKLFNWAMDSEEELVTPLVMNPCARIQKPSEENQRDRVLKEGEIRAAWAAYEAHGGPIGEAFKLLLLTAQRKGEVLSMRWADVDLKNGWWTIPATVSKNKISHRVPLVGLALDIFRKLEKTRSDEWVFSSKRNPGAPIAYVQKAHDRLRATTGIDDFRIHDLRRTAASYMTGAGIARLVVKMILNHVDRDITAVYDRHSYDAEKERALTLWSRQVKAIVNNKPDQKVVKLR